MTMSSAVSKVTLNGDGVQTSWPFAFKVWKAADLEVSITNAEGVTTVVSNWSVSLADTGGTVTYPTSGPALPSGHKITIARSMDFLQDVDLVSGTRWDPEVVETALDRATAERQQLKEKLDRAIVVDIAATTTPEALRDSIFAARDTAVSSAASALDSAERAEIAATTASYYNHEGVLTTGQDTIALPWAYDTDVGVEVFLSGIKQTEASLIFVDSYTVKLDTPVSADTPFEVVSMAGAKGEIGYNTGSSLIGFLQAGTGAVARTVQAKLRDVVSVKDFGAVGDGVTDDTAAIQAALNSGARWVSLPTGTFLAGPVILPSGVGLVGNGGILKAKAGSYYQVYIPNGSVNSTVDNVTFDAAGLITAGSPTGETACISSATTSGTMSGLRLTNNRFLNIPTTLGQRIHAIQLNYGEAYVAGNYTPQCGGDIYNFNNGYFIVEANIAKNSGDGGIAFNNNARGCIVGNFIQKCDLGVGAGPEGTDAKPDHTLLISSNEIVACGDGINMGWFAYPGKTAPRNVKIVGNTVAKCKRSGIRHDGSNASWEGYVTIIGNTIHGCGGTDYDGTAGAGMGIAIGSCKYTLISGNILHDNAGTDIVVGGMGNVEVIGNALNAGVYAESGGTWADFASSYGLIANNIAVGRRLLIQNATGVRVLGNTLTLGLTTANQGAVVVAATANETTISENNFVNCGNAVHLPNSAGWLTNDVLNNNKFFNCTNKVVNSPLPREGDVYVECMFLGTTDGSGNFSVAHGTSNNGGYVVSASAFVKGNVGESIPMTLAYVDGDIARFTSSTGYAGRACRAWIRYNKDAGTW